MPTTIYALCEPDLMVPVIRYIGKTANVAQRLRQHLSGSHKTKTHLGYWLRSLRERGEKPVWMTLTEVQDEIGSAAEMLYIRLAREGGMGLVNATDGGEGVTQTPEIRRKISATLTGVKHTPERCAAISAAKKGAKYTPEHCAALSAARTGVKLSPAHCAAISAVRMGVKLSPEHCAAMSAAITGRKLTPEHCAAISAAQTGVKRRGASSKFIGVSWDASKGRWQVVVHTSGRRIYVGRFLDEVEAAKAYDVGVVKYCGPDVKLNFPCANPQ